MKAAAHRARPAGRRTTSTTSLTRARDGAELGVVVAFGQLIKPHVLDAMPMVNLHFSLLPRWRGAAPVERALLAGDDVTGVCVMALEEGLDTGGVHARREVPIGADDHGGRTPRRARRGRHGAAGRDTGSTPRELDRSARTAGRRGDVRRQDRRLDDFEIDWSKPAEDIDRLIRLGGAWTTFRGKRLKINAPGSTTAVLVPTAVQPEGKAAMSFESWRNGARPSADELFGTL